MGDDLDKKMKKEKEEREKRLKPLKEANELADKLKEAAKARDKDKLMDLLDQIWKKKMEFCDLMPPVLGHPFADWYWDLKGWDLGREWILHGLQASPKPNWESIDDLTRNFFMAKHRIEDMLKN